MVLVRLIDNQSTKEETSSILGAIPEKIASRQYGVNTSRKEAAKVHGSILNHSFVICGMYILPSNCLELNILKQTREEVKIQIQPNVYAIQNQQHIQ